METTISFTSEGDVLGDEAGEPIAEDIGVVLDETLGKMIDETDLTVDEVTVEVKLSDDS